LELPSSRMLGTWAQGHNYVQHKEDVCGASKATQYGPWHKMREGD